MKRRNALQSLLGLPTLTALPALAQQSPTDKSKPARHEPLPAELKPPSPEEFPKLATIAPDAAVNGTPHFFSAQQFATLVRLAGILVPAVNGKPGAIDAEVPAFLDFLISASPLPQQTLYRNGLDHLDNASRQQFGKRFPEIAPEQITVLLAPLREPASPAAPRDSPAHFLHTAKDEILRATLNSRQWAAASNQRRGSGLGTYWRSID